MYLTASAFVELSASYCLARYLGKIPDRLIRRVVGQVYKFSATCCFLQSGGLLNTMHHFAAALATKGEIAGPSCDQLPASAAEQNKKKTTAWCACREPWTTQEQLDNANAEDELSLQVPIPIAWRLQELGKGLYCRFGKEVHYTTTQCATCKQGWLPSG